ncbi:MAG: hypothetical protein ACREEE_00420 [Dongiaceae bacterium]
MAAARPVTVFRGFAAGERWVIAANRNFHVRNGAVMVPVAAPPS